MGTIPPKRARLDRASIAALALSAIIYTCVVLPATAGNDKPPPSKSKRYQCADGSRVSSPDLCEDGSVAMLTTGATVNYQDQYKNTLTRAQTIEPATEFGEHVSLRDGSVSFKSVDIELAGTGPTIRIVRTAKIQDGQGPYPRNRNHIYDWGLEIPRIQTITALPSPSLRAAPVSSSSPVGWQVPGSNKNARCSNIGVPSDVTYPNLLVDFYATEWWAGYQLIDGDGKEQPLVVRSPLLPNAATIGTMSNWIVTCLSVTANPSEAPGEAFLATAPDGTKYWFNHLIYDEYATLNKDFPELPPKGYTYTFGLPRQAASMLVTRVEDRFGNWLTYSYTAGVLTGIDASDGRQVRITRGTNSITITGGSAATTRTWTYQDGASQPGYSLVVTRPDNSAWKYLGNFQTSTFSTYSFSNCSQMYTSEPTETRQVSVIAPSGATAQFNFQRKIFGRSYVPRYCHVEAPDADPYNNDEEGSAILARIWTGYALTSKVVSGPGLSAATWSYSYSPHNGNWMHICEGGTTCPTTVWTDRVGPEGERLRSTFSNKWDQLENKLTKEELFTSGSALLRTTQYTYATAASTGTNPYAFPLKPGIVFSINVNYESEGRWTPTSRVQIDQQGRQFVWQVASPCAPYTLCFDQFARPTKVTKSSAP